MQNEHLLVVLQTHSRTNALSWAKENFRFPGVPKEEVSKRCVLSLINSLNYARYKNPNLEINLHVYDDNSDEEFLFILERILKLAQFPVSFDRLGGVGIMKSILTCYTYGRDHAKEHVYFVQDDFLHSEQAIHYMHENFKVFSHKIGNDITLSGYHDTRYLVRPDNVAVDCKVVPGIDQCWRTVHASQFTTMTTANLVRKNWDLFEKMGNTPYDAKCCEDESINHLYFYRGYREFCPIESLVIEIQWPEYKPLYLNWEEWWKKYDLVNFNIICD